MKFQAQDPPRRFFVGKNVSIELADCGSIALAPDEQVTFVTESGGEFDVARKSWGFYATPSLNGRLAGFGLRAVLVRNRSTDRYFVLLVERGQEPAFDAYLRQETSDIVAWLDSDDSLTTLRQRMAEAGHP